ncbi:MAG TPA: hypothetical protein VJX94_32640 [Stellaceae bacterium]|nr:hypothetical protein [Stellaceae bacterium]
MTISPAGAADGLHRPRYLLVALATKSGEQSRIQLKILEICCIKFDLNRRQSSLAYIAWNQNRLVHTDDEYKQKFGRP